MLWFIGGYILLGILYCVLAVASDHGGWACLIPWYAWILLVITWPYWLIQYLKG